MIEAFEQGIFDPWRDRYQLEALTVKRANKLFRENRDWTEQTHRDYRAFLNMFCDMLPAGLLVTQIEPRDCVAVSSPKR